MKLFDRLTSLRGNKKGEDNEVRYGVETIEEEQNYTITTLKITTKNGEKITKEGTFVNYFDETLQVNALEVEDYAINHGEPMIIANNPEIFSITMDEVRYYEVVNRKTLKVTAEAKVNYKEVDGERTYTSIKESNIEKEMIK